jgi:hypothetical protein
MEVPEAEVDHTPVGQELLVKVMMEVLVSQQIRIVVEAAVEKVVLVRQVTRLEMAEVLLVLTVHGPVRQAQVIAVIMLAVAVAVSIIIIFLVLAAEAVLVVEVLQIV